MIGLPHRAHARVQQRTRALGTRTTPGRQVPHAGAEVRTTQHRIQGETSHKQNGREHGKYLVHQALPGPVGPRGGSSGECAKRRRAQMTPNISPRYTTPNTIHATGIPVAVVTASDVRM